MIPIFPDFVPLSINHKSDIDVITRQFPPYADFNFVALWSWNVNEATQISILNDNFIIEIENYVTSEIMYSFMGTKKIQQTIEVLIAKAKQKNISTSLKLIPEFVITSLNSTTHPFTILEDRDNFDYILSVNDIVNLHGNAFRGKRNFINRFEKSYKENTSVTLLDLNSQFVKQEIKSLCELWEKKGNKPHADSIKEFTAIKRLLLHSKDLNLTSIGIQINGKLCAFCITEVVHDKHAIIHFEKADTSYVGIFQFLKRETARFLDKQGVVFINYEQDLGIEGLRNAKNMWHPHHFLKKYIISE